MVRNEHLKLIANALDRASTACFTVGMATPAAGFLYNIGSFRSAVTSAVIVLALAGWLLAALALHLIAHLVLTRMDA